MNGVWVSMAVSGATGGMINPEDVMDLCERRLPCSIGPGWSQGGFSVPWFVKKTERGHPYFQLGQTTALTKILEKVFLAMSLRRECNWSKELTDAPDSSWMVLRQIPQVPSFYEEKHLQLLSG